MNFLLKLTKNNNKINILTSRTIIKATKRLSNFTKLNNWWINKKKIHILSPNIATNSTKKNISLKEWQPPADIKDEGDRFIIHIELPGFTAKDIKVEVFNDNLLQISGERIPPKLNEGEKWNVIERTYGEFKKSFALLPGTDTHEISAHINYGVLEIIIPKPHSHSAKMFKIDIREGDI